MACAKCAGNSEQNLLKNAKGGHYFSHLSNVISSFKVQVVCEAVHLSTWEIFVSSLVVR